MADSRDGRAINKGSCRRDGARFTVILLAEDIADADGSSSPRSADDPHRPSEEIPERCRSVRQAAPGMTGG